MAKDYTHSIYMPIPWEIFHRDTRMLAQRILAARDHFDGIIAIARGGLIPACIIARELDIRTVEAVSIASYDDRSQGKPRMLKGVDTDLVGDGENWLVVDDLVDSGLTARVVRELLPKATIATVYAKPEGQQTVDLFAVPVKSELWLLFPWDAELRPNEPLARASLVSDLSE
ncbi:xanthine phosphoribosyltransferase [Roseospira marina]|uniref:Xanthine phosphoribosyltransferase n=1 Tax=Roseospira marina TaxID=140057 RepID=A0A5M6IG94_9PROT|nr:xanthine phosphoribosyltransferase [Roseospira marina]KAA5607283.1 xanthine phosphoribosyltransferase [Roseospira marina]MBB4312562.1 xanthine phosphoribosyltransferase [Roseospira marina]MBB5085422.1 xanthine phosphoribosyltransferase [Roseospira marina]